MIMFIVRLVNISNVKTKDLECNHPLVILAPLTRKVYCVVPYVLKLAHANTHRQTARAAVAQEEEQSPRLPASPATCRSVLGQDTEH